ncbi:Uncharacterized protein SCF082_LOCUS49921 [Durusdinium trenchii]|uniref:C3H1-type domain-containing protein n=1 Tax=Durusdinium trenchii TaxID=1381693 RepID=A0ABP0S4I2_9DINO
MDDDVEYPAVDDAGVEYLEYPNYGEMAWPGMANMFGGFFVPGPDFATSIQPVVMRSRQTNELVPPPKHLLKTKLCKHFTKGYCRYQDQCAFAHDVEELVYRPDLTKTKLCTRFLSGECCEDSCSFAHGLEEIRAIDRTGAPSYRGYDAKQRGSSSSMTARHEIEHPQYDEPNRLILEDMPHEMPDPPLRWLNANKMDKSEKPDQPMWETMQLEDMAETRRLRPPSYARKTMPQAFVDDPDFEEPGSQPAVRAHKSSAKDFFEPGRKPTAYDRRVQLEDLPRQKDLAVRPLSRRPSISEESEDVSLAASRWALLLERALRWKRLRMMRHGRRLLDRSNSTPEISRSEVDELVSALLEDPEWLMEFGQLARRCRRCLTRPRLH